MAANPKPDHNINAHCETNSKDYTSEIIAKVKKSLSPADVLELISKQRIFVAVLGQQILRTDSLDGKIVRSVFIAPNFQRQGIGKRLVVEVERAAQEAGITALVVPSSVTAEPFYAKLEFKAVRDSYHGDERTILMERATYPKL